MDNCIGNSKTPGFSHFFDAAGMEKVKKLTLNFKSGLPAGDNSVDDI
jgi:hypothetical protein